MENKSKVYDIRTKSDYLNDILERTPTWIFRWGNTLFLLFIFLLITLSYFIKYPDTISARVEILTQTPPIDVIAKTEGLIDTINFEDKSYVTISDTLALIKSSLNIKDLQHLETLFKQFNEISYFPDYINFNFPNKGLELGELSDNYSLLIKDFDEFKYFLRQSNVFLQIESLEKEINYLKSLNLSIKEQQRFFKDELSLTEKSYNRQVQLHKGGVVSDDEKEKSEAIVLQQKRQLGNFETALINNNVKIEQLKKEINNLISDRADGRSSKILIVKQHINILEGQIRAWGEKHIIFSPVPGLLSFTKIWSKDQYITQGQPIFVVIPEKHRNVIGRCQMPLVNSGRVDIGTSVQVRLDAYPYQEFGVLESKIEEISLVPIINEQNQSFYDIKLMFKDTLVTTYGKIIPFKQKMSGTAVIIKEKKSVLDRIFDQLLNIIKN